jgi:PHP family Zn ribbon phosphoesterase
MTCYKRHLHSIARTTIEALVETALREYIQRRKRLKGLDLFGTFDVLNKGRLLGCTTFIC